MRATTEGHRSEISAQKALLSICDFERLCIVLENEARPSQVTQCSSVVRDPVRTFLAPDSAVSA